MKVRSVSQRTIIGAGGGALLGLLWLLTQLVGTNHVRESVFRSLGLVGGPGEFAGKDQVVGADGRTYYCRAAAYGPFIVHVDFGRGAGSLSGEGGRAWYFWPMGEPKLIRETEHWDE
jgi:hypothetical protein